MPPFLILGAAAVGGWFALKFGRKEMQRVGREVAAARKKPTATLRRDPKTGRYTLKDGGAGGERGFKSSGSRNNIEP